MVEAKGIVQKGLSVVLKKKKKNVVLSIFKVSEHDNQPELEHELLPQYVINTGVTGFYPKFIILLVLYSCE